MAWPWNRRRSRADPKTLADYELKDRELQVKERELKVEAIARVAHEETDPVTALEIITIATHRGQKPPNLAPRRPASTPLEAFAMELLQQRLRADPGEELEKALERRERLDEAAERLLGTGGKRPHESSGNALLDVLSGLANSELGATLGAVMGASFTQRLAAAQALATEAAAIEAEAKPEPTAVVPVPGSPEPQRNTPAPQPDRPPTARASLPTAASPPPAAPTVRPVSLRVGVVLAQLRKLEPEPAARWLLSQADANPQSAELLNTFLATDADALPALLEAFSEQGAGRPEVAEWLPVVAYLRERPEWTLAVHAAMRELALAEDGDEPEDLGPDAGAERAR